MKPGVLSVGSSDWQEEIRMAPYRRQRTSDGAKLPSNLSLSTNDSDIYSSYSKNSIIHYPNHHSASQASDGSQQIGFPQNFVHNQKEQTHYSGSNYTTTVLLETPVLKASQR